jgi:hypothetical protein
VENTCSGDRNSVWVGFPDGIFSNQKSQFG